MGNSRLKGIWTFGEEGKRNQEVVTFEGFALGLRNPARLSCTCYVLFMYYGTKLNQASTRGFPY